MGNNRDLPMYKSTVALESPPIADVQSPAQQLINSFSNFSTDINNAEVFATKYVVEGQRADIRNQISKTYSDYAIEANQNPDKQSALKIYNDKSSQYADGYLAQTSVWNRQYARNMLDYFANTHRTPILNNLMAQDRRTLDVKQAEDTQNSFNQVLSSIKNATPLIDKEGNDLTFDRSYALEADLYKNLTSNYVRNGGANPQESAIPNLRKKFTEERILKGYSDALHDGKGIEYLQELDNRFGKQLENFSTDERARFINGPLKEVRSAYFMQVGINLSDLKEQQNKALDLVENGGLENQNVSLAVQQTQPPDIVEEYKKKLQIAHQVASARLGAQYANPAQAEQLIEYWRPTDTKSPNYEWDLYRFNKIKTAVNETQKEFFEDPASSAFRDPSVRNAFANWQNAIDKGVTGDLLPNSPLSSQVMHPDLAMAHYQDQRGVNSLDYKFMTNAQAKSLVSNILQANPREKLLIMNGLYDQSANSSYYMSRVKQLVNAGLPEQYSILANIDPTSPYADHIAQALSLPFTDLSKNLNQSDENLKNRFDQLTMNAITKQLTPSLFNSITGSRDPSVRFSSYIQTFNSYDGGRDLKFTQQMITSIQTLGYYALQTGIAKDEKDAFNWAQNAITARYDFTTLHGQKIRVPNNYTIDNIRNYALDKESELKTFPFVTAQRTAKGILNRQQVSDLDRMLIIQGHWTNDNIDHGLVWVDKNGQPPTDKNGNYFMISFDDANKWHKSDKLIDLFKIHLDKEDVTLSELLNRDQ